MTEIKINLDKIDHIVHIADVHIRLLNRHTEYQQIFDKLYADIETSPKNTLIYLGGDIVHSKTTLAPELVEMTANFLHRLSQIRPTIVIAGNHDVNLKNKNRIDSLTPVINVIKSNNPETVDNLFYLKDNGLYKIANCLFSVMSVFAKHDDYELLEDYVTPKGIDHKIALYHGVVNGAKTDTGFLLESSNISKHTFRNFDMTMLGDIHLSDQSMNNANTIKYSGSLICQNHGETNDKGYLFWDLDTRTSEHIKIPNDYGYHTINVNKNVVTNGTISPKPYLRILSENTSQEELSIIVDNLKRTYDIQELVIKSDIHKRAKSKKDITDFNIENFYDTEYRLKIIQKFLQEKYPNEIHDVDILKSINEELSSQIYKKDLTNFNWKPLKFEFSNMFSYGDDNSVDFEKITGIYGLFGKNYKGKSSVVEALVYCIFDKCPKTSKSVHVLNSNKKEFDCTFEFELNEEVYTIHRIGKRTKDSVKVNVDFYKIDKNGNQISLNGDQRASTNNNIRDYLGTYDDFILTTISSQSHTPEFADKTQGERKSILSSFLTLDIFNSLYDISNEDLKELKNKIKYFDIDTIVSDKTEAEENLTESTEFKKSLDSNKVVLANKMQITENEISELKSQLKSIATDDSIKAINDTEITINKNIVANNLDIETKKGNIKDSETVILSIKNKLSTVENDLKAHQTKLPIAEKELSKSSYIVEQFNIQDVIDKLETFKSLRDDILSIEKSINYTNGILEVKKKILLNLDGVVYDKDCNFCVTNVNKFTGDALNIEKEIPLLKKELKVLTSKLQKLNLKYDKISLYQDKQKEYEILKQNVKDVQNFIEQLKLDEQSYINSIEKINNDIKHQENNINGYKGSIHIYDIEVKSLQIQLLDVEKRKKALKIIENDIINNATLDNSIVNLNIIKKGQDEELTKYNIWDGTVINKIESLEIDIVQYKTKMIEFNEISKRYDVLTLYTKSVHKDGLPYKIMCDSLPSIEDSINNSLAYITDFTIKLIADNNNINGYIIRSDSEQYPFELASGFERTIISMTFRVAMLEMSNLSKAMFLVYDEGFGSMDADNLQNLNLLFELLKMKFTFVIIITHIDSIKDTVDDYYEVDRIDGYSYIHI